MTKAYSTLQIKSVTDTDDERLITGIATTPSTDRDDDILEPLGAKFTLPIPLLSHHNHSQPIGEVIQAEVTAGGILITAKIAKIDEKGKLKDRIDEAWHTIKSGLVKCLSVGFKVKEYNYIENSWGLHIKEWEWYELSVVTIPANPDAMITGIKQIKAAFNDQPKPINQAQVTKTHQPKPSANNGAVTLTSTQGVTLL
ncbi:HK97 family phage prohead protease [Moraxella catarrhalis]|uniref:HK97 family phage prohead protease n=1 Tax=Moraxella catarrhalis TaxID=480 RepID=UPI001EEE59EF|nr:HK97 family phage prohead protease [Moraxella catarrhalis]MCG6817011.1 HK97 family phage prohead protease [Moraxella catarrhalis]